MKAKRIRLQRVPVPYTYAPGYPRELSAEELQVLLAPRNRERVQTLMRAACAAFALSAASSGCAPTTAQSVHANSAEREALLIELLQRYVETHPRPSWLWSSTMVPGAQIEAAKGPVYLPRIPISFGNSAMGLFDAGTARRIAGELFRAYGLELETGVEIDSPLVQTRLDGADRVRKIAFKLDGVDSGLTGIDSPQSEPANTVIDAKECAELEKQGWRLHIAPNHYSLMDGDQVTPTIAYLAGVIEFLNSVTEGPDFDLRAVLMGKLQRFHVPTPEALGLGKAPADSWESERGYAEFELRESKTVTIRFNATGDAPPSVRERSDRLLRRPGASSEPKLVDSTAGHISVLQIPLERSDSPARAEAGESIRVKLTQARENGLPPVVIEARSGLVFTPSTFDAARAFELEITLLPGRYVLLNGLDVSVLRP